MLKAPEQYRILNSDALKEKKNPFSILKQFSFLFFCEMCASKAKHGRKLPPLGFHLKLDLQCSTKFTSMETFL